MVIPQLDLPIQLQQKGKKDLSPNVMAELDSAIEKLQQIKGEDEVYAWHHIAKIYAYQNQFDKAIVYFEKVYQRDKLWTDFNNIIFVLDNNQQYDIAITKLLKYLQNDFNDDLCAYLLNLLFKYPVSTYVEQISVLLSLNNSKFTSLYNDLLSQIEDLNQVRLSIDDYCLINSVSMSVLGSFYYDNEFFSTWKFSVSDDSLFQKIHIFEADAEDILELNRLYEQKIEQMIEQGQLTIEKYIDIISKYNFSFVIYTETHEEWENSRASS